MEYKMSTKQKIKGFLLMLGMLLSTTTLAQIKVPVVWGFTPASTLGNYVKTIVEEANLSQTKYEFVFEFKQGAGGFLAGKYVLDHGKLAVYANSTAQFIRYYLYPETSFKPADFSPILTMAQSSSILVTSKATSISQLIIKQRLNFATGGPGTMSHLMAEVFAKELKTKHPSVDIKMIHFNNTLDAFVSVASNNTDAMFQTINDAKSRIVKDMSLLGTTGSKIIDNYPLLSKQGYTEMADMVGSMILVVPSSVDPATRRELFYIFSEAEKSSRMKELYAKNYAFRIEKITNLDELDNWYVAMYNKYKHYTSGITIN